MTLVGYRYVEAFLLGRFLNGDCDAPKTIPVHKLCHDVSLGVSNKKHVQNALQRLEDKGYIIVGVSETGNRRGSPSTYHVQRHIIERDLKAMGFKDGLACTTSNNEHAE